jgi:hypothetical protein
LLQAEELESLVLVAGKFLPVARERLQARE